MAIAFRSRSYLLTTSSHTSVTPSEPTGAAQNDILLYQFTVFTGSGTVTGPTGWTSAYSFDDTDMRTRVWWVRRGASAPAVQVSWTTAMTYSELIVSAYSGCTTAGTPYDDVQGNPVTGANPCNPDPAAATSAGSGRVAVAMGFSWQGDSGAGWTAPSGYTLREGASGGGGQAVALADLAVGSGSINPGAFSGAGAGANNANGVTLILAPDAAATSFPFLRRLPAGTIYQY